MNAGVVVITVGGGGIPVIEVENGAYQGTAAVIDKDYASSLLAQKIQADLFLISTAVVSPAATVAPCWQINLDPWWQDRWPALVYVLAVPEGWRR